MLPALLEVLRKGPRLRPDATGQEAALRPAARASRGPHSATCLPEAPARDPVPKGKMPRERMMESRARLGRKVNRRPRAGAERFHFTALTPPRYDSGGGFPIKVSPPPPPSARVARSKSCFVPRMPTNGQVRDDKTASENNVARPDLKGRLTFAPSSQRFCCSVCLYAS